MTFHFLMTSLMTPNQHKSPKLRINRCLKSETMDTLINRIPGLSLKISSLPSSALRMHVEYLGKPCDVKMRSQSLAW